MGFSQPFYEHFFGNISELENSINLELIIYILFLNSIQVDELRRGIALGRFKWPEDSVWWVGILSPREEFTTVIRPCYERIQIVAEQILSKCRTANITSFQLQNRTLFLTTNRLPSANEPYL